MTHLVATADGGSGNYRVYPALMLIMHLGGTLGYVVGVVAYIYMHFRAKRMLAN